MADNRILTANFRLSRQAKTAPLYQYDYGQMLKFIGVSLPDTYEVHFSNSDDMGTAYTVLGNADWVMIPDALLATGNTVHAWIFLHDAATDGETEYKVDIPVKRRPKPTNTEPTPVQQDVITQAIAALNSAVEMTAADVESAKGYAADARDAAYAAEAAEGTTSEYAAEASGYAASAQESSQEALRQAQNAANSQTSAENAANDAASYATQAGSSARDAANSAVGAARSADEAAGYAEGAAGSKTAAEASATVAEAARTAAQEAASNAQTSETNVGNSASTAAQSAQSAADSASLAHSEATNAANSAVDAVTAQTAAAESASAAATSESNAAASAQDAADTAEMMNGVALDSTAQTFVKLVHDNAVLTSEMFDLMIEQLPDDLSAQAILQDLVDENSRLDLLVRELKGREA